jgi:hypothetical protein
MPATVTALGTSARVEKVAAGVVKFRSVIDMSMPSKGQGANGQGRFTDSSR